MHLKHVFNEKTCHPTRLHVMISSTKDLLIYSDEYKNFNLQRIKEADVKICKFTDGKLLSCKRSNRKSTYEIKLSKKRKISDSGEYV